MKQWQRVLLFLLINIAISACTTLGVLFFWDQTHKPVSGGYLPFALRSTSNTPTPLPSTPAALTSGNPTPTQVFVVHQVVSGETFESIAQSYSISVEELLAVNGFTKSQPLGDGEILRIPVNSNSALAAGVVISNVIGPGDLASERVDIQLNAGGDLSLAGWQLEDEIGDVYIFPELELASSGATVSVYTKAGTDSANQVYWGLGQAVWKSGETITLKDDKGSVRTTYKIP
jgi:LysM repeat protein